jgi:hypothetical protein
VLSVVFFFFGLIETILWTRECGFHLREGHRARMAGSAAALGFAFAAERFEAALAQAIAGAQAEALRVRLVLAGRGRAHPFRFARPAAAAQDHSPRPLRGGVGRFWRG